MVGFGDVESVRAGVPLTTRSVVAEGAMQILAGVPISVSSAVPAYGFTQSGSHLVVLPHTRKPGTRLKRGFPDEIHVSV